MVVERLRGRLHGLSRNDSTGAQDPLDAIPSPWRAVRDVRLPSVEHPVQLLVGPGGLHAVTLVEIDDPVEVDGHDVRVGAGRQSLVDDALRAAEEAGARLFGGFGRIIDVVPVLCLVGGDVSVASPPADVHVVTGDELPRWLRKRRRRAMDDRDADRVVELMRPLGARAA